MKPIKLWAIITTSILTSIFLLGGLYVGCYMVISLPEHMEKERQREKEMKENEEWLRNYEREHPGTLPPDVKAELDRSK